MSCVCLASHTTALCLSFLSCKTGISAPCTAPEPCRPWASTTPLLAQWPRGARTQEASSCLGLSGRHDRREPEGHRPTPATGEGSSLSQDSVTCAARPPGLRARGQCARPWTRPERPSAEGDPRPAASDTSLYLPHSALGLSVPICTGAGPDDRALRQSRLYGSNTKHHFAPLLSHH